MPVCMSLLSHPRLFPAAAPCRPTKPFTSRIQPETERETQRLPSIVLCEQQAVLPCSQVDCCEACTVSHCWSVPTQYNDHDPSIMVRSNVGKEQHSLQGDFFRNCTPSNTLHSSLSRHFHFGFLADVLLSEIAP